MTRSHLTMLGAVLRRVLVVSAIIIAGGAIAVRVGYAQSYGDLKAAAEDGANGAAKDAGTGAAAPAPAPPAGGGDLMDTVNRAGSAGVNKGVSAAASGASMKSAAQQGGAAGVKAALEGDAPAAGAKGAAAGGSGTGNSAEVPPAAADDAEK